MLTVQAAKKSFDQFLAVRDARLTVAQGQIVAVIGPNGAGKSTLFKLITGLIPPDSGKIIFDGHEITGLPAYKICRRGIGLSFQIVNVFSRLTVFENVRGAVLAHRKKTFNLVKPARHFAPQETARILESVGLSPLANRVTGTLGHGEQKVLEVAIALGTHPKLLILDEPTAGMSPEETQFMIELIKRLNQEMGLTILFCEHDMELVFSIAQSIMVMQQGTTIIQADPLTVKTDAAVKEAYLGSED
jgi:branched-chain amino acid transport system ATP-binding protein